MRSDEPHEIRPHTDDVRYSVRGAHTNPRLGLQTLRFGLIFWAVYLLISAFMSRPRLSQWLRTFLIEGFISIGRVSP